MPPPLEEATETVDKQDSEELTPTLSLVLGASLSSSSPTGIFRAGQLDGHAMLCGSQRVNALLCDH